MIPKESVQPTRVVVDGCSDAPHKPALELPKSCEKQLSDLDRAVFKINSFAKRATFGFMLGVGKIVIDTFYGGDLALLRVRGRKDVSLRKLAHHPDLCMRPDELYRIVACYELINRLGLEGLRHLSTSHLQSCLPLSSQIQEHLLRTAERERWSVQHLRQEIRLLGDESSVSRGGRKRGSLFERTLRAMRAAIDSAASAIAEPLILTMSTKDQQEAAQVISQLRTACDRIALRFDARACCVAPETAETAEAPPASTENGRVSDVFPVASATAPSKILIVEDDAALARALARVASPYGEVTIASTRHEAEALLDPHASDECILVVDVSLPDGSGLDVIRTFRDRFPRSKARILVASGHIERKFINAAWDLRAEYFAK
jgi:CheY-like chemotaxis protein